MERGCPTQLWGERLAFRPSHAKCSRAVGVGLEESWPPATWSHSVLQGPSVLGVHREQKPGRTHEGCGKQACASCAGAGTRAFIPPRQVSLHLGRLNRVPSQSQHWLRMLHRNEFLKTTVSTGAVSEECGGPATPGLDRLSTVVQEDNGPDAPQAPKGQDLPSHYLHKKTSLVQVQEHGTFDFVLGGSSWIPSIPGQCANKEHRLPGSRMFIVQHQWRKLCVGGNTKKN